MWGCERNSGKNAAHKKCMTTKHLEIRLSLIGTWNNMWLSHLCCSILPVLLHMLHTRILRQCSLRHHVQLVFQFFWVFQFVLFSMGETLNYVYFIILACWEDFIAWLLKSQEIGYFQLPFCVCCLLGDLVVFFQHFYDSWLLDIPSSSRDVSKPFQLHTVWCTQWFTQGGPLRP